MGNFRGFVEFIFTGRLGGRAKMGFIADNTPSTFPVFWGIFHLIVDAPLRPARFLFTLRFFEIRAGRHF